MKFLQQIGSTDQGYEKIAGEAKTYGIYYKALLAEGVPPDLAAELVRELHALSWCKVFGLDPGSFA